MPVIYFLATSRIISLSFTGIFRFEIAILSITLANAASILSSRQRINDCRDKHVVWCGCPGFSFKKLAILENYLLFRNVNNRRDVMRIITEEPLKDYIARFPDTKTALQNWVKMVKEAQ